MKKIISIALLFVLCTFSSAIAAEQKLHFELGAGIVVSPDYRDLLEEVYPGADFFGGTGWLDFYLGLRYQATKRLSITPSVSLLMNYVAAEVVGDVDGEFQDEAYFNTIIVPALAVRYAFTQAPSLYLGGEVNSNVPNTGSERYEFDSGGTGYGGFIGLSFSPTVQLEAGYLHIPVDVGVETFNLGGIILRFGAVF